MSSDSQRSVEELLDAVLDSGLGVRFHPIETGPDGPRMIACGVDGSNLAGGVFPTVRECLESIHRNLPDFDSAPVIVPPKHTCED